MLIEIDIDEYAPDYRHECSECGVSPVVTGIKDGEIVFQPHLCGECYFQDEIYADIEEWEWD